MGLDAMLESLFISDKTCAKLATQLCITYRSLALNSTEQFLATPINVLPRGTETGRFLAIDVGGSNLRVAFVELLGRHHDQGQNIRKVDEKAWPIEDHLKFDKAEDLFLWIGDCIADVIRSSPRDDSEEEIIPMGITFSFPMIQKSIADATLMAMGKGFAVTSGDLNLARLLLDGYERHTRADATSFPLPRVQIAAITNDTVATLASLAYSVKTQPGNRVAMGLIVGTGTNAAIPMKMKSLHPSKRSISLPAKTDPVESSIILNTEWTIKGAAKPLRDLKLITHWDEELDRHVETPGFQPFEYMTGGRYLGEIVRLVYYDYVLHVLKRSRSKMPIALRTRNAIKTSLVSKVIAQEGPIEDLILRLQVELPIPAGSCWTWDLESARAIKAVAQHVATRSAVMNAAAVVGLLACAGDLTIRGMDPEQDQDTPQEPYEDLIVAYAGGVLEFYPGYRQTCQETIDKLVRTLTPAGRRVIMAEAVHGGIIGAGVLAGTVYHLTKSENGTK